MKADNRVEPLEPGHDNNIVIPDISRRQFIKGVASATLAAAVAPTLLGASEKKADASVPRPEVMNPGALLGGLHGCIGSAYRASANQLVFIEYSGNVSALNLTASVVSSGTTALDGTYQMNLDTGATGGSSVNPDIFWEQSTNTVRSMVPIGSALLAYIGVTSFASITPAQLQSLTYTSTPIDGNNDATNLLVPGAVFAVQTNTGHLAKVGIIAYGYDLQIQWVTYDVTPSYVVLGSGYDEPEDVVLTADQTHAYVTERGTGSLWYVDLSNADKSASILVANGMTQPHQLWLDELHGLAYVVEYAIPGHLWRISLVDGTKVSLRDDLHQGVGLVLTADSTSAYITEQLSSGKSNLTQYNLVTSQKTVLATSATSAFFFLTWFGTGNHTLLTTERAAANKVWRFDLTGTAVTTTLVATVDANPSSVSLITPTQALVCCNSTVDSISLPLITIVNPEQIFLGIGFVPFNAIVGGYATTASGYFFEVTDSPFGGSLSLMVNHPAAYDNGAAYYQVLVDGAVQQQSYNDYLYNGTGFVLTTTSPVPDAGTWFFPVRSPSQLWYNAYLGYILDSTAFASGLHNVSIQLYSSSFVAIGSASTIQVLFDNSLPVVAVDTIYHNGSPVNACAIVKTLPNAFTFDITAQSPNQHLLSWTLTALWGQNNSAVVAADSYANHVSPTKLWLGPAPTPGDGGNVPTGAAPYPRPWAALAKCATTFNLAVWDRVIDGYNYIHYAQYNDSCTILVI